MAPTRARWRRRHGGIQSLPKLVFPGGALIGVLAGAHQGEVRLPLIVMQQQRIQGVTVLNVN